MDINTLAAVKNYLTAVQNGMQPHGTFRPTGEDVTPDYNDPESLLLSNIIYDIQCMIDIEDSKMEQHRRTEGL